MNSKLTKKLDDKYPKMFNGIDVECPDTWYKIIDRMCLCLQRNIDVNNFPPIEFHQIKEKFGTLRVYYTIDVTNYDNEFIEGYINGFIQAHSLMTEDICIECGTNQNITRTSGWIRYICKDCLDVEKKDESENCEEPQQRFWIKRPC